MQQMFYFLRRGLRMLVPDPVPSNFASKLVQAQGDRQPFFAGHPAIAIELHLHGGVRIHDAVMPPTIFFRFTG